VIILFCIGAVFDDTNGNILKTGVSGRGFFSLSVEDALSGCIYAYVHFSKNITKSVSCISCFTTALCPDEKRIIRTAATLPE